RPRSRYSSTRRTVLLRYRIGTDGADPRGVPRRKGAIMRKLIAFAVAAAAAAALLAMPAAANRPGANGRVAFPRFDPVQRDDFVYTANPDGSQERQLLPTGAEGPH